jgi:hypothetical protein
LRYPTRPAVARATLSLQERDYPNVSMSEGQQIIDEVAFFRLREATIEIPIIVVDHIPKRGKPSIVIETAFLMAP